jgi:UDP-glucuronate 4-epimerase
MRARSRCPPGYQRGNPLLNNDQPERYLVTGALGALGAWTIRHLLDQEASIVAHDIATNVDRLHLFIDDDELARIVFVSGDVADVDALERVVAEQKVTRIVHLAALQVPFVRADPVLGATVNVVGTTAVFEAARRNGGQVRGIAYASSGSVYSADDANPSTPLRLDTPIRPPSLYGVFKQANEGTARIYWEDNGLASIGLRPCGIVYGPGRDQGNSSPPSKAMLAAAVVTDYYIPWRGQIVFAHAADVASAFVQAAQAVQAGAQVFNLGGSASSVHDLVAAIEDTQPAMQGRIGIGDAVMIGPVEVDEIALSTAVAPVRWRPVSEGVRDTIRTLGMAMERGALDAEAVRLRLREESEAARAGTR